MFQPNMRSRCWKRIRVAVLIASIAGFGRAQTVTTLANFDGSNGAGPQFTSLIQGLDGDLYGVTWAGGIHNEGTVFKITLGGTITTLHSFNVTDGDFPRGGLVQSIDGTLYGTTSWGGTGTGSVCSEGCGTVFKITLGGKLTTLHSFTSPEGADPIGLMIQASNGAFYGTTEFGGTPAVGTIFQITPAGALTTLVDFDVTDGAEPFGGLVEATNGELYGTAPEGGQAEAGTVFQITPAGLLTTLHDFDVSDSSYLAAGLVQASNGLLYGTTAHGGPGLYGALFSITTSGTFTSLYSFAGTDGSQPFAALIQATDGNLYGTTSGGGANNQGTLFKMTPGGSLTTLYSFGPTGGAYPDGALFQATDGNFYGVTPVSGDTSVRGTVFRLSVGLGPFVRTLPVSGKTGAAVDILGTDLTGTTSVSFNGTAAAFTVVSPSLITTTVPTGASVGKVGVVTPGGTLVSNVAFRVMQ
jgi:uncharacterized repeat protein (TIGR03803 family)